MFVGQAMHNSSTNAAAKSRRPVHIEANGNKGHHTELAAIGHAIAAEIGTIASEAGKGSNRNRATPFSLETNLGPEGKDLARKRAQITVQAG